ERTCRRQRHDGAVRRARRGGLGPATWPVLHPLAPEPASPGWTGSPSGSIAGNLRPPWVGGPWVKSRNAQCRSPDLRDEYYERLVRDATFAQLRSFSGLALSSKGSNMPFEQAFLGGAGSPNPR